MGEELELVDVNGNVVRVAFHQVIAELAEKLPGASPYKCSTPDGKGWIEIRVTRD